MTYVNEIQFENKDAKVKREKKILRLNISIRRQIVKFVGGIINSSDYEQYR